MIGEIELNSIDYSALNLEVPLVLILGHANCGAVDAVIKNQTTDIEEIASFIIMTRGDPVLQGREETLPLVLKVFVV